MEEATIKGWHVFLGFAAAFSVIIGVNLVMATKAVATFPGLETKNSYVASQSFEADRDRQDSLGWTVDARVDGTVLTLFIKDPTGPVEPEITKAILGRATHVNDDQAPTFSFNGTAFVADVNALEPGNWNLRLEALAGDGTTFRRRIVLRVPG